MIELIKTWFSNCNKFEILFEANSGKLGGQQIDAKEAAKKLIQSGVSLFWLGLFKIEKTFI